MSTIALTNDSSGIVVQIDDQKTISVPGGPKAGEGLLSAIDKALQEMGKTMLDVSDITANIDANSSATTAYIVQVTADTLLFAKNVEK